MEAIHIPRLARAPEQTETLAVLHRLPHLETLTPVQGEIIVTHCGNYLDVKGRAEAIVTLSCDRCLQQYNHRVVVDAAEFIWLQHAADDPAAAQLEREVTLEELIETLEPDGYFRPLEWLYEQFCLATPPRQLCDPACQGISFDAAPPAQSSSQPLAQPSPQVDRRWASLQSLQQSLEGTLEEALGENLQN